MSFGWRDPEKDTKYCAMTVAEFNGLLRLLSRNISEDQTRELFEMAVRIETKQRRFT
ncbi:hypothetical protein AB1I80_06645 [Bacillus paranthracis]|uniref:hypothetical protein n=1 Tax=Bacillus paranthracis TaxID=2026186 RepID=UPI003558286A